MSPKGPGRLPPWYWASSGISRACPYVQHFPVESWGRTHILTLARRAPLPSAPSLQPQALILLTWLLVSRFRPPLIPLCSPSPGPTLNTETRKMSWGSHEYSHGLASIREEIHTEVKNKYFKMVTAIWHCQHKTAGRVERSQKVHQSSAEMLSLLYSF